MSKVFDQDQADRQDKRSSDWDSSDQADRETARNDEGKTRVVSVKGGGRGKQNNPGNFANDRARASAAGRKGGEARGRHHQQQQH